VDKVADGEEQFLVSEAEREVALGSLVRACEAGLVTLEEFSRRTDAVLATRSRAELTAAAGDLEALAPPPAPRAKRRFIGVLGTRARKGRFVLPERTTAVAVLGELQLDLGGATLVGPDPTIRFWALFGTLRVVAPAGVQVEVESSSLLGGRSATRHGAAARAGAPLLHVRMFDLMGDVRVVSP
jgi:Domain of unknown function (DUF1707)